MTAVGRCLAESGVRPRSRGAEVNPPLGTADPPAGEIGAGGNYKVVAWCGNLCVYRSQRDDAAESGARDRHRDGRAPGRTGAF